MKPASSNNYQYNKHLASNANDLRKDMTKAEACLWKYVLKAGGMMVFTFRRQRPFSNTLHYQFCQSGNRGSSNQNNGNKRHFSPHSQKAK
jgi:very-short-patch-repair endonuclease